MPDHNRLVMSSTCKKGDHGAVGFTNFLVRNVRGGVEFDAHAVGGCVVTVPDAEVRRLYDRLAEWL